MKKANRILSALLCLVLLLGVLPVSVLADDTPTLVTPDGLAAAIQNAADGDTIYLGEGEFSTYGNTSPKKSLTFIGAESGKTKWYIGSPTPDKLQEGTEYNGDYSFDGCENITFQNIKFSVYPSDFKGFIRIRNLMFDNCDISGKSTYLGYKTTTFKNTVFHCPKSDYALWYYTGNEMNFENCTFYGSGKIMNLYRTGFSSVIDNNVTYGDTPENPLVLNYKDCTVISDAPNKSVLNIKDAADYNQTYYYQINISGKNVVTGLNANKKTCSRLFQVTGNTTTVQIDGVTVWENGDMVKHNVDLPNFGSYDNGCAEGTANQYAEGYKDGKVTIISATAWAKDNNGVETRTVKKQCEYCLREWDEVETKKNDETPATTLPIVGGILASGWLNMEDHYSYIVGYPDGTVQPNGKITRAEVATIFFRLLSDDTREAFWSSTNSYSDVTADKWYNNAVSTLSRLGVISGYPDGTFRPDASITRAEFAKIAVSFCKYGSTTYSGCFSDVKASDWFSTCVETARNSNLIAGYPDGTFRPNNAITRAEACTIVNRTLGRKPAKNHMAISGRINWPDCLDTEWFYADMMEATNSHDYQMVGLVEDWNRKLPQRDWAALETEWSHAYSAPGGEVGR